MACCFYLHVSQPLFLNPGVSRRSQRVILVAMARCLHWRCEFLAHPRKELFKGYCCRKCEEWEGKPKRKDRHGKQLHWYIEKMFFILNLCGHHRLQKNTPQVSSNSKGEICFVAFFTKISIHSATQGFDCRDPNQERFPNPFPYVCVDYVPPNLLVLLPPRTPRDREILLPGWSTEIPYLYNFHQVGLFPLCVRCATCSQCLDVDLRHCQQILFAELPGTENEVTKPSLKEEA